MSILVKYYQHFGETSCLIFYLFPRVSFVVHSFKHSFIHSFKHSFIHSFKHSFIHSFIHSLTHSISACSSLFLPLFFPSSLHLSCLFFFSFLPLLYSFSSFFFHTPPLVSWKLHAFDKPRTESCQIYGNLCNINSQRRFILFSTKCKIRILCVPL